MNTHLKNKLETVTVKEVVAVLKEEIQMYQASYEGLDKVVTEAEILHKMACLRKALAMLSRG